MKYYIKAKNTETGESMILTVPEFTDREKAQEFADNFVKHMTPVAELMVINENER